MCELMCVALAWAVDTASRMGLDPIAFSASRGRLFLMPLILYVVKT